jgi:anti-sigma factor RsiW
VTGACLGEVAAALVDGELDHSSRERAHRHLAHCAACRAEVEAQRQLKSRLLGVALGTPAPGSALTERLLALPVPGTDRVVAPPPAPGRPVTLRRGSGPRSSRPAGRRRALRRRTAVTSAVAALGVVALALGSPQTAPTTAVDPATDSFVVRHVGTTGDTPLVVPASVAGGGARSAR